MPQMGNIVVIIIASHKRAASIGKNCIYQILLVATVGGLKNRQNTTDEDPLIPKGDLK